MHFQIAPDILTDIDNIGLVRNTSKSPLKVGNTVGKIYLGK